MKNKMTDNEIEKWALFLHSNKDKQNESDLSIINVSKQKENPMIQKEIKQKIIQAIKNGDLFTRNILRVVLGEMQTVEQRNGSITEEKCQKIIYKMIEDNEEIMRIIVKNSEEPQKRGSVFYVTCQKALEENKILRLLVPQRLTKEQIKETLISYNCDLKSAKNDGQAIGVAIKVLKENNHLVDGKDVAEVVKELRNE